MSFLNILAIDTVIKCYWKYGIVIVVVQSLSCARPSATPLAEDDIELTDQPVRAQS